MADTVFSVCAAVLAIGVTLFVCSLFAVAGYKMYKEVFK
jgi:hypothetical protein